MFFVADRVCMCSIILPHHLFFFLQEAMEQNLVVANYLLVEKNIFLYIFLQKFGATGISGNLMYRIAMFQVMAVLVMVVLDFLEDKLALGQSLVILLELVCVFVNIQLIDML